MSAISPSPRTHPTAESDSLQPVKLNSNTLDSKTTSHSPTYNVVRFPPPDYTASYLPAKLFSPLTVNIEASDTPQWRWSSLQCKVWLYVTLRNYMNYDAADAEAVAMRLDGFGPNMYTRSLKSWQELLGYENGSGLYVLLVGVRHLDGAVPEGLDLESGDLN